MAATPPACAVRRGVYYSGLSAVLKYDAILDRADIKLLIDYPLNLLRRTGAICPGSNATSEKRK